MQQGGRRWTYEPDDDPKRKHHWDEDRPGITVQYGEIVSKCPSSMTIELAEQLLNEGIEWRPKRWIHDYPKRVYTVHDGTVYRATPTIPGRSYHGFPEFRDRLPEDRVLRTKLVEFASKFGSEQEVIAWLAGK